MSKFIVYLGILVFLPLIGATGFVFLENWSFVDSVYQSIITLSTIGFHVIAPLSSTTKVFMIAYIIFGLPLFMFSLVELGGMIVRGEIHQILTRRTMDGRLASLSDHYIICGAGRMGLAVCKNLEEMGMPFVVIEKDEHVLADILNQHDWVAIHGDAAEDDVLKKAKIDQAKYLAAVLKDDSTNVFVTLSARMLRNDISIISRASEKGSESKLRQAGANQVVSPYTSGALKLTQLMANPHMNEFMEIISDKEVPLDLTVIEVSEDTGYVGNTVVDLKLREAGVMIVGIKRADGSMLLPPNGSDQIFLHDRLIVIGSPQALHNVSEAS